MRKGCLDLKKGPHHHVYGGYISRSKQQKPKANAEMSWVQARTAKTAD